MVTILNLKELNYDLWQFIISLYNKDPVRHLYVIHDLLYELDRIDGCFSVATDGIEGYVFSWLGPGGDVSIHVWGEPRNLEDCLSYFLRKFKSRLSIIQVHSLEWLNTTLSSLEEAGINYEITHYLDMIASEDSFRPVNPELAVRLRADRHLQVFLKAMEKRGRVLRDSEILRILKRMRYYGIILEGELVSFAARCAAMPEVWAICDVYTDPEYRGRGFAKAVTSAVTRDAITSGAIAMLHVEENNKPAIRLYRGLGYGGLTTRPWLKIRSTKQNSTPS